MVENLPVMQETWVQSLGLEGPLEWQPTPVFLPGKSHEQRSLVGYSSRDCKESDITEWLSTAHLWRYEVVNVWVTRKWHMIWTKEWEITGLCHFMWGKIKENCLKNTEKLQVNAEQLQKDCYSMRHFPFVFFIFKLNVWGYVNVHVYIWTFWMQLLTLPPGVLWQSQERQGIPSRVAARENNPGGDQPVSDFWTTNLRSRSHDSLHLSPLLMP